MNDNKNLWIAGLALSGVLLFGVLLLLNPSVQAEAGMLDKGGDYTMATGMFSTGLDAVYIIDAGVGKMLMYRLKPGANTLIPSSPVEMKKLTGGGR